MSKQMTPCEKLGYKVGDKFKVVDGTGVHYAVGSFITLIHDDGSSCPRFNGVHAIFESGDSFFPLDFVEKVAKLKPAKQALADAIHQNGGWVEGGDWHKNGELPPVGEVCEVMHLDRWVCCEVIAHFEQSWGMVAAYTVGINGGNAKLLEQCNAEDFRPLRTGREKAIDEMVSLVEPLATYREFAGAIYDAGMYKEVK